MDQIEEHKKVEDNQNYNNGKTKAFSPDWKDSSSSLFTSSWSRREFFSQAPYNLAGPQTK